MQLGKNEGRYANLDGEMKTFIDVRLHVCLLYVLSILYIYTHTLFGSIFSVGKREADDMGDIMRTC